jgi:3-methyladenine DNA glycosylase AlkD
MDAENLIKLVKSRLNKCADKKYREVHEKSIMVNAKNIIGARLPAINALAAEVYRRIQNLKIDEVFKLSDALISSGIYDVRKTGIEVILKAKKRFEKRHFTYVDRWVKKELEDWGDCDSLGNHLSAEFLFMFPELLPEILKWADSKKFIVRRAACVTFIVPGKRGMYLKEILMLSKKLMNDPHPLVLKGYGWALKEASKPHNNEVFKFVCDNKNVMPRVALRYAIEKMSEKQKKEAMKL